MSNLVGGFKSRTKNLKSDMCQWDQSLEVLNISETTTPESCVSPVRRLCTTWTKWWVTGSLHAPIVQATAILVKVNTEQKHKNIH